MGWKGTMRSVTATVRRMEKEAQRRHKQAMKEQIAADASDAVSSWENYVEELLSVHTDLADRIDWYGMLATPEPVRPAPFTQHHDKAIAAMEDFRPRLFDFLWGGTARRKAAVERALDAAPKKIALKMSVCSTSTMRRLQIGKVIEAWPSVFPAATTTQSGRS